MNNLKNKSKNILVENFIILCLFFAFIIFKSIKTLLEIFSYGFLKKEVLTNKSDLGFDMKIRIK